MTVFELVATLTLSAEKFRERLKESKEEAESEGSKIGSVFATIGKVSAAGLAAATAAVGMLTKQAVSAYSQYEQLSGGVSTLFGTNELSLSEYAKQVGKTVAEVSDKYAALEVAQSTVMDNASNAYKTAGMSANTYMETVTSFAARLKQATGDELSAAKAADVAIRDMSDNANKMGTSMQSVQNAYNGFAKGNYMMLDNLKLGYGGTKTEMERLLKDAEEIHKRTTGEVTHYSIENLDDVFNAIHDVQNELGITGTTAREALHTIEGSTNMLKASWTNLLGSLAGGGDLSTAFTGLTESILGARYEDTIDEATKKTKEWRDQVASGAIDLDARTGGFLNNIIPRIKEAFDGISKFVQMAVPELVGKIPALIGDMLPPLLESAVALVEGVTSAIPGLLNIIIDVVTAQLPSIIEAVMQVGTDLLNAIPEIANKIAAELPALLATIIESIISSAPDLIGAVMTIVAAIPPMLMELVSGIIDELPSIVETIGAALSESLPLIIEAVTTMLTQLAESLPEFIDNLVTALPELIDTIIDTLLTFLPQLMDAAVTLFMALIEALPVIIQALIFNLPQIIATIVGVLVDNIPTIIETGITILMAFIQGIIESLPSIVVAAVQVIISLASSILSMLPDIISVGIELLLAVVSGLLTAIPQLIANIPQIITAIVTGLRNGLSQITNVGSQLLKGLWNGISNTVGWLWDRITGLGGQIISKIKGIFGIHSPSAVMRDEVGKYLGMGLGIGFEDNIPVRDMLHAAQGAVDEIADNISGFAVNGSLGIDEIDMKTAVSAQTSENEPSYTFDDMVEAFRTALGGMTVELDDIEAGKFVRRTVEKAVYAR